MEHGITNIEVDLLLRNVCDYSCVSLQLHLLVNFPLVETFINNLTINIWAACLKVLFHTIIWPS